MITVKNKHTDIVSDAVWKKLSNFERKLVNALPTDNAHAKTADKLANELLLTATTHKGRITQIYNAVTKIRQKGLPFVQSSKGATLDGTKAGYWLSTNYDELVATRTMLKHGIVEGVKTLHHYDHVIFEMDNAVGKEHEMKTITIIELPVSKGATHVRVQQIEDEKPIRMLRFDLDGTQPKGFPIEAHD
jgi:hypothetical protein